MSSSLSTCVSANNFSLITCFSTKHSSSLSSPKFKASLPFPFKSSFERKLKEVVTHVTQTINSTSLKLLDDFVDSAFQFVDQPILPSQSNFAPVEEEVDAIIQQDDIQGCIPLDFPQGVYIRNGPNPLFGGHKTAISVFGKSSHIWVEGEGMLHALYLMKKKNKSKDGSCWTISYKNRHVKPDSFILENQRDKPAFIPALEGNSLAVFSAILLNSLRFGMADKYLSNTNVIKIGDKYYANSENHTPVEFDITTLKTIGPWHLHSTWNRPFTSHPKKSTSTGEIVFYGYSPQRPYLELGTISADGSSIVHRVDPKFDRSTLCHDIGITERYTVILDFPLVVDINRLIKGGPLLKFNKQGFARIGVMPRYGDRDSIKWFEVEPCAVFHILNCFKKGDEVIMRACKAAGAIIPGPDFVRTNSSGFPEVIDSTASLNSGMAKYGGLAKVHFMEETTYAASSLQVVVFEEVKRPEKMKNVEYHKFPEGTFCTGATFVPKDGGIEEDDGWIITYLHNETNETSQVHIIDGKKFSDEAIAKITLPVRVPYGFHGAFMPL